jgi:hypothetical protein
LYDRSKDPQEHANLLSRDKSHDKSHDKVEPAHRAVADSLAKWLPTDERPLAPGSAARILEKRNDGFYWQEKKILPENLVD